MKQLTFFLQTAILLLTHTLCIGQIGPIVISNNEIPLAVSCPGLSASLQRQSKGEAPCCYALVLQNDLTTPFSFSLGVGFGTLTNAYAVAGGWKQTPSTVPPGTNKITWTYPTAMPKGRINLSNVCLQINQPTWIYYTWLDGAGKTICRDSMLMKDCLFELEQTCRNPLIRDEGFTMKPAAPWSKAYGNPQFQSTASGFMDVGQVQISGNQTGGDAIKQAVGGIVQKKKYRLTAGVRFLKSQNTSIDYARLRAVAFNGILPQNGTHPAPSTNVAIIGRSGKIKDCGDWSIVEFPVWMAGKNFQNIAINVFTNDGTTARLQVDNVTMCETTEDDCDEGNVDAKGNPIQPAGYGGILPSGFTCVPEVEDDDFDNGSLSDLYDGLYDGTTNWYASVMDKCFSIGGTLPLEVIKYNCDDSLKAMGISLTCDQLSKLMDKQYLDTFSNIKTPYLPPIQGVMPCKKPPPLTDAGNWAFKGRDIIYIHGLELGHLGERMLGKPGAMANWPNSPNEFYAGGYYSTIAKNTWDDHITYFTKNKNYINRYLVVSYNCSQRLDVAVHSVLSQIRDAMNGNNKGVWVDPRDPRANNCFGNEYIIISQSTGAIIGDVLLAIAEQTKTDPTVAAKYGNIGFIADRCKGHIARRGAFSGSALATILVALAYDVANTGPIAAKYLQNQNTTFNFNPGNPNDLFIMRNSILVDLIPSITRSKWGGYIDKVPTKVLTVSGGHPTFFENPLMIPFVPFKYSLHAGFDDGVLTTDCSNGRKNMPKPISTFTASSKIKVFDMGIRPARAISYYLDQKYNPGKNEFTASATAYLSPTGMVQPVVSGSAPMNLYYKNHYSFLQAAAEHWIKKNGNGCCSYNHTAYDGFPNKEEQLVVNDASLFTSGIIDPSIKGQMRESIKGRYFFYPTIKIKMAPIPRPIIVWKKYWIWKRTYHNLGNDNLYDFDYVYPYLFKN